MRRLVAAMAALAGAAPWLSTASASDPCDGPAETRPPDPRCGETLDGRENDDPPLSPAKLALGVPRLATRMVFWPILRSGELLETYHVGSWMDAILTTDDGLVGLQPELRYSTG